MMSSFPFGHLPGSANALNLRFRRAGGFASALGVLLMTAGLGAAEVSSPARTDEEVLAHLNAALTWYHEVEAADEWAVQTGDEYYRSHQRELAHKAVAGAFDYATAMGQVIADESPAPAKPAGDERQLRLSVRQAANAENLVQLRDQEAAVNDSLKTAAAGDRARLMAQAGLLKAEIDLDSVQGDALEKAVSLFASAHEANDTASLQSHIASLRRTVPEVFDSAGGTQAKPARTEPPSSPGLINRVSTLFSLVRSQHGMDVLGSKTKELQSAANRLAQPIGEELRAAMQTGDEANGAAAQSGDAAQLDQVREKIEKVTTRFRHLSAALIPLREESMALAQSRSNLLDWKRSVVADTNSILRIFFGHAVALAIACGILLAISEIWRRATFRYVHEPRRRRQFLVIRRFATVILMAVVIVMAFIGDFSSIATFAGFITAGMAVALQTIILSVAAYFFLIGRYGVRVGDRVTVAGVTGDVVEIGLVRVFLMELAGTGVDLHPTGRIVVLANSALFSSVPVFKQLPGTDYAWHELYVTISTEADTAKMEHLLRTAVETVYGGYRTSIERQHGALERLVDYKTELPVPSAHVRFTDSALEIVIRYPAEIRRMAEIDEQVTKAVLEALRTDEGARKSLAAMPRLRAAVKS